jgi:uncharacterized protein YjbI with pentapeptide repeats
MKQVVKILCSGLFFLTLLYSSFAAAKYSWNERQLLEFANANSCVGCDLSNSALIVSLIGKNHQHADLHNANLSDAHTDNIVDMSYANFSNANLSGATLSFRLDYANFSGAFLVQTYLGRVSLKGANFTGATLYGAQLYDTDLSGANFTNAKVTIDQLNEAKNLCNTIMPDGSVHSCSG